MTNINQSQPTARILLRSARPGKRQGGFSLLEVLVAFSILALCLGVLLRIFGGSGRLAGMSEEHARAVVMAESLLSQIGVETPIQPGETSGQIDETYDWAMRVSPFTPPDGEPVSDQMPFKPYWVELAIEWGEQDELHAFKLSTLRLVSNTNQSGFSAPPGATTPGGIPR
jgi:general secretion pathway protein I